MSNNKMNRIVVRNLYCFVMNTSIIHYHNDIVGTKQKIDNAQIISEYKLQQQNTEH